MSSRFSSKGKCFSAGLYVVGVALVGQIMALQNQARFAERVTTSVHSHIFDLHERILVAVLPEIFSGGYPLPEAN